MIQKFNNFKMNTNGQKLYEFTDETMNWIKKNRFKNGILNLSIQHTSASLIIQENAELLLGTWQGIYLIEHRLNPQTRTIIHHFLGEV